MWNKYAKKKSNFRPKTLPWAGTATKTKKYPVYRTPFNREQIHSFKRTTGLAFDLNQGSATYGFKTGVSTLTPTSGSGYGFGLAFQFTLANVITWHDASGGSASWAVPAVSEFQALFSQYRIKKIVLRMAWDQNISEVTAGFNIPIFNIANDYDDASPPLGPTDMLQRQGCRLIALGAGNRSQIQTHTCYPRTLTAASSSGGTSTATSSQSRQWLSTNDITTNYFGVKVRWDQLQNTALALGSMYCYVDYYIECKGFK